MSSRLIPFNFEDKQIRVVKDNQGQPWFVVRDICTVLEHSDPTKAVQSLDDDEKGTKKVLTPGGEQEMLVINESGLYALLLRSNKLEAKKCRKWVTSVVLPSIRKTGYYSTNQDPTLSPNPNNQPIIDVLPEPEPITALVPVKQTKKTQINAAKLAKDIRAWKEIASEIFNLEGNQLLLSTISAIKYQYDGLDLVQALNLSPHMPAENQESQHYSVTDLAKKTGKNLSAVKLNVILEKLGYQTSFRDSKNRIHYEPTEKAANPIKHFLLTDTGKQHSNGTPIVQLRWYLSILETTDVSVAIESTQETMLAVVNP